MRVLALLLLCSFASAQDWVTNKGFPAGDGCNTCYKGADGTTAACTLMYCAPPATTDDDHYPLQSVRINGRTGEVIKPRVIDKKFLAVAGFSNGMAALDIHSTRYCFNKNPNCYEAVGFFDGGRPNAAQLAAVSVPIQFGVNGAAYLLKKRGKKWWWVIPVAHGGLRIWAVQRNYRNAGRR